jgi:glycosyltransferase involved in cell wall biosynthesis
VSEVSNSPKPKIVRIIDRLIYGGPTRNVVFLTEGLKKNGYDCDLVTGVPADGEGDMTFWAQEHGVNPIVIPQLSRELAAKDLIVILKLWQLFRNLHPDIVHTHKSKAGATARIAAWLYRWITPSTLRFRPRKIVIVHTFHGHIFHGYYGKWKSAMFVNIERLLARITDCIVVVSEQQRREIRDGFRVGRNTPFRVVPVGLDFREPVTNIQFRQENKVENDEFLVGTAGRFCEIKNFPLLMKAFDLASRATPAFKAKLTLIGDGHLRSELEKYAADLGIARNIIFTGFRSDTDEIYPALDVAALSSLNEGTPLTLIEAMSFGRPVVTTEVGGVRDILGKQVRVSGRFTIWEHGISVPSSDVQAYADALVFLAANPALRQEMGEQARRYVRRQFSHKRLVADMASLYVELRAKEPIPTESRDRTEEESIRRLNPLR